MGIATMKKEAIQLGYLCCVHLKNLQKQKIFEHQLSEIGLAVPVLQQTAREVAINVCFHLQLASYVFIYFLQLLFMTHVQFPQCGESINVHNNTYK